MSKETKNDDVESDENFRRCHFSSLSKSSHFRRFRRRLFSISTLFIAFIAFDVVAFLSLSTSSIFRRFRLRRFLRRFRRNSSYFSCSGSAFVCTVPPTPAPVSCPELSTSAQTFLKPATIFARSVTSAPTRSRRDLPRFADLGPDPSCRGPDLSSRALIGCADPDSMFGSCSIPRGPDSYCRPIRSA